MQFSEYKKYVENNSIYYCPQYLRALLRMCNNAQTNALLHYTMKACLILHVFCLCSKYVVAHTTLAVYWLLKQILQ
jgi:hypothetical protein